MHIITGLLLARLMKARAGQTGRTKPGLGASPLFDMPGVITLAHALPGRCRFRLPALRGHMEASEKLEQRLQDIDGIIQATVNPSVGSVLLEYDAARLTPEVLAAALVRLLGLERAFSGKVDASLARALREWAKSLNVAVYQKTGGILDLRTAFLVGLAGLGVKQVLAQRALALPAGFTLLWWAGTGLLCEGGPSE